MKKCPFCGEANPSKIFQCKCGNFLISGKGYSKVLVFSIAIILVLSFLVGNPLVAWIISNIKSIPVAIGQWLAPRIIQFFDLLLLMVLLASGQKCTVENKFKSF